MADNRIGIYVDFLGEEAIQQFKNELMQLEKKPIDIHIKYAKQALKQLNKDLDAVSKKRRQATIDYRSIERATKAANMLDRAAKSFGNRLSSPKNSRVFTLMSSAVDKARAKVTKLQKAFQGKYGVWGDKSGYLKTLSSLYGQERAIRKNIKSVTGELGTLKEAKVRIKAEFDRKAFDSWYSKINGQAQGKKIVIPVEFEDEFWSAFGKARGLISNFGSSIMTLGRGLQRITAPVDAIVRGLVYGVGYRAVGKAAEGLTGAFERYDTMNTYKRVLEEIGLDASKKFVLGTSEAQEAVEHLNDSVLGLPTGLNEIVDSFKVYAGITGSVKKATKMAIAANNAFVAGGMDKQRQRMAERQLQNLLSNGELTAAQWNSLQKNMPMAFNAVARELGYSQKNAGKLLADLKAGEVSAKKFVKAFIKVGTEGSIYKAAQKMKDTWEALSSNIKNRFSSLGASALESLDKVFKKSEGVTFLQKLLGFDKNNEYQKGKGIRGFIDGISESISKWIEANPDKIIGFFDKIASYDWAGVAKGVAEGFMGVGKLAGAFLDFSVGTDKGEKAGKALVKWNMIGKGLTVIGAAFKGLSFPIAAIYGLRKAKQAVKLLATMEGASVATKNLESAAKLGTKAGTTVTKWSAIGRFATAADIAAGGFAIKQVLEGIAEISKVKIPDNIGEILGQAAVAIGGLTTLATVAGRALGVGGPVAVFGAAVAGGIGWLASDSIAKVFKSIKDFAEGVEILGNVSPLNKKNFKTVAKSVKDVAPSLKSIYKSLKNAFPDKKGGSFAEYSQSKKTVAEEVKGMLDALTYLKDINGVVDELAKIKVNEKSVKKAQTNIGSLSPLISGMKDSIANLFGEEVWNPEKGQSKGGKKSGKWERKRYNNQALKEYEEISASFANSLTNILSIVNNAETLRDEINRLKKSAKFGGKKKFDLSKIVPGIEEVGNLIGSLRGVFREAQAYKDGDDALSGFDTLSSMLDKVHELATTIGKYDVAADVKAINDALGELKTLELEGLGGAGGLGSWLTNPLQKTPEGRIQGLNANIPVNFSVTPQLEGGTVEKVKNFLKENLLGGQNQVQEGGINTPVKVKPVPVIEQAGYGQKLKEALGKLSSDPVQLPVTVLANLNNTEEALGTVDEEIGSLKQQIQALPARTEKEMPVIVKAKPSGASEAKGRVENYLQDLKGKINGIPAYIYKKVKIHIATELVRTGELGVGQLKAEQYDTATGGLVPSKGNRPLYRARGGGIFTPKGTDTVPAMLTPGEYVNKRSVVKRLGVPFFQKLNHLDIQGALRELSVKTGMSIGGGTTINNYNNTTNNTTNNISVPMSGKESSGFTMRRMGRFAGAL